MIARCETHQLAVGDEDLLTDAAGDELLARDQVIEGSHRDGELPGSLLAVIQKPRRDEVQFVSRIHVGEYARPPKPPL
jgi:hypothetical protein